MPGDKKIITVIPSRFASTRLPGKALLDIHGKPMIWWVAQRVAKSQVQDFLVATDDERIETVCRENEIPCLMTSKECVNGTERVAEVSRQISADYYINVQGDEPLVSISAINTMYSYLLNNENKGFVQAVAPLKANQEKDESVVKLLLSDSSNVTSLCRLTNPDPNNRDLVTRNYFRCMGLYAYSGEFCRKYSETRPGELERTQQIEQLRCLENVGMPITGVLVEDEGVSVDTFRDYEEVRSLPLELFISM